MSAILIIVICITTWVQAGSIDYGDCGSLYTIKGLNLQGCDIIPCTLEIGATYEIEATCIITFQSKTLTQDSYFSLSEHNINIPIDIAPVDYCKILPCPLSTNGNTTLKAVFTVPDDAIVSKAQLRWYFYTDGLIQAACIKTAVNLVWPVSNIAR